MGRIMQGGLMVLFVLILNLLLSFITSGATAASTPAGTASCDNQAGTCTSDFSTFVSGVTLGALPADTPAIVAALYLLIMGFLLAMGSVLIITGFLPLTSE